MKVGVVSISSVPKSGFRVDPSLHLSEGISIRSTLNKCPYGLVTVSECSTDIFIGNIFSRIFVGNKDYGIPYLSASETVRADLDTGRFLSKKQAAELNYLMVEKDWILVTCSGTLGNVTPTEVSI